jgi:hypothetical protein
LEFQYQFLNDTRIEDIHRAALSNLGEISFGDLRQAYGAIRRAPFEMQLETVCLALL